MLFRSRRTTTSTPNIISGRCPRIEERHKRLRRDARLGVQALQGNPSSIDTCVLMSDAGLASRTTMLTFPNQSRSYDSTRHAVRFWGYESSMEISFFVMAVALRHLKPGIGSDEAALLNAFDSNRDLICAAAAKVFARANKGSYDLIASDF